jgi:hypothetical protein
MESVALLDLTDASRPERLAWVICRKDLALTGADIGAAGALRTGTYSKAM